MRIAAALILFIPLGAQATDVPVRGERLDLRANQHVATRRGGSVVIVDAAIGPPFADPTAGAALVVSAGVGPGRCRAEIPLDAGLWRPLGGNGLEHGWRYRAAAPGLRAYGR